MHYKLAAILYNPKSTGDSEKLARRFARRLERAQIADKVEVIATERSRHAEDIVPQLAKKHGNIYVVSSSGDGGYNEVVNGAIKATEQGGQVVTGLLPSGNANDHYKALHKPYVVRRLKANQVKHIDVLQIETTLKGKPWQRYAHSYIGFGISSEIGRLLNETDLTPTKELLISAKAFLEFEAFEAKVDGKKQLFHSIIVSNVGKMSKFFKLSKHALPDDGKFEIITAEANKTKLIGTLVKSATVGVPHEKQTTSFTFETVSPLLVQLDGEVYNIDGGVKVRVGIAHKKLGCIL